MAISIRRVREDDAALLRNVRLAALGDSPSAFASSYRDESAFPDERWRERAASGADGSEHATFFAFDGSECVGLVGGHQADDGSHVELVSMWTRPTARDRGVGAALVEAVVGWAGGRPVELWVMRGNDAAERLYRRCGFTVVTDHDAVATDPCRDEIRMRRLPA